MNKAIFEKGLIKDWWRCSNCDRKWFTKREAMNCCSQSTDKSKED